MHELGIVIQIVKQLENYMTLNNIDQIETVVLEIGALSSVYPKYIKDVYPIAVEKSRLRNTNLEIEINPGIGKCNECEFVYDLVENNNHCPRCSKSNFTIIRGREFLIKEIIVRQ